MKKIHIKAASVLLAAVLSFSAVPPLQINAAQLSVPAVSMDAVTASEEEAALHIRQCLKEHVSEISVTIPDSGGSKEEASYRLLYNAFGETGNGSEGDYLRYSVKGFKCNILKSRGEIRLVYTIEYRTTLAEEAALTEKLREFMDTRRFSSIHGDYSKIRSIYQYVTSSVTYSEDEEDNYAFTAYSAFFNGTAVCQGVTQLLYRMYNDCGIPCRIIAGIARDSSRGTDGNHVWLIVKLEGQYYYLDPTWDMKFKGRSFYYFLKGTDDLDSAAPSLSHIATRAGQLTFPDYTSDEFMSLYPVAKTAYSFPRYSYGDINGDKLIDAIDSSLILSEYARLSSGCSSSFTQTQSSYADIDRNGMVDAVDASIILSYYAKISNGADITLSDLLKK